MKRVVFIFLFSPIIAFGQLDKIYLGMPLAEFRKKIPEAVQLVSSSTFTDDTVAGLWVRKRYDTMNDTIVSFSFFSQQKNGPCCGSKNVDQLGYSNLLITAGRLFEQYSNVFGEPSTFYENCLPALSIDTNEVNLFYANWKSGNGNITLRVFLDDTLITSGEQWVSVQKRGKSDCPCKLRLDANGKGIGFKKEFCLGMSSLEFMKFLSYPQMTIDNMSKTKVNGFGMKDSLGGNWDFNFYNDTLKDFSYHLKYYVSTSKIYPALINKVVLLGWQSEQQFGKAKQSTVPADLKYHKLKPSLKLTYVRDDYYGYWETDKGPLLIKFLEAGGRLGKNKLFMIDLTFRTL